MTEEEATLGYIQGIIAEMSVKDQLKVNAAVKKIEAVIEEYPGGHALTAVVLIGATLAAEK